MTGQVWSKTPFVSFRNRQLGDGVPQEIVSHTLQYYLRAISFSYYVAGLVFFYVVLCSLGKECGTEKEKDSLFFAVSALCAEKWRKVMYCAVYAVARGGRVTPCPRQWQSFASNGMVLASRSGRENMWARLVCK